MKQESKKRFDDVPVAFSEAMASNLDAMKNFSRLSAFEQRGVIDHAKELRSDKEIRAYVDKIGEQEVSN